MKNREKFLFVIPSLNVGGAERVVAHLINHIDREKYIPELLLINNTRHNYLKDLKKDILVTYLNVPLKTKYFFIKTLIAIIKLKPDIVFVGLSGINVLLSPFLPFFRKIRWVARETSTISKHVKNKRMLFLYRHFYKNYDILIAQSKTMANDLFFNFHVPKKKIQIINNPLDTDFIDKKCSEESVVSFPKGKINLLVCGGIKPVKGYDTLIRRFSKLSNLEKYHLTVIGNTQDQEYKESLLSFISEKGLNQYISFKGHQENSFQWMKEADILISSSQYEGFPNVVLEALYCGTPVLINNYGVAKEIITDGVNGYIFDFNKRNFEEKLMATLKCSFISDKISRDTKKKYAIEKIMKKYELVFDELKQA